MLGIIGAMDIEVDMLKSMLSDTQSEKIRGVDFVKGKLSEKEVVVARCGIGKVNAAICAQSMILKYAPDAIINIGVGGSLSNLLDIGDVAIADYVVQSDADTSPLGDPVGLVSTINIIKIPCSQNVTNLLSKCADNLGIHSLRGTISTTDAFIASSEKKDWLVSNFDAIACEMEGGSIGHVCYVNGVEFGVLRAVSDKADGSSHMDYGQFCAMAAKNSTALICEYIKAMKD